MFFTFLSQNSTTKIDWSATAAWIALIVAIISPVITSIINNKHSTKMKQVELISQRGLSIIEQYLSIISREIYTTGVSDTYKNFYTLIFLYAPESIHNDIEELDKTIRRCPPALFPNREICEPLVIKISKALQYKNLY